MNLFKKKTKLIKENTTSSLKKYTVTIEFIFNSYIKAFNREVECDSLRPLREYFPDFVRWYFRANKEKANNFMFQYRTGELCINRNNLISFNINAEETDDLPTFDVIKDKSIIGVIQIHPNEEPCVVFWLTFITLKEDDLKDLLKMIKEVKKLNKGK